MYDDSQIAYETSLNQNFICYIILGIILLIIVVITFISLAKVFKKANRSGISAIIPVYNIVMLLEITNSSRWYLFFLLIPGINIFFLVSLMLSLAKVFRKSSTFGIGLAFLPFIFYPILGFGKSEYIGINLVAMEGKSVTTNIPKILESEEKGPVIHEEKDIDSKNISISIGGGVYQKDYTSTLLQVDQNQAILNKSVDNLLSTSQHSLTNSTDSNKMSFISPIQEEIKLPEEEPKDVSINLVNQINSITEQKNVEKIELETQISGILTSNQQEIINDIVANRTQDMEPFAINSEEQSLADKSLPQFIICPKCGAKVKNDAKVCFLCGTELK